MGAAAKGFWTVVFVLSAYSPPRVAKWRSPLRGSPSGHATSSLAYSSTQTQRVLVEAGARRLLHHVSARIDPLLRFSQKKKSSVCFCALLSSISLLPPLCGWVSGWLGVSPRRHSPRCNACRTSHASNAKCSCVVYMYSIRVVAFKRVVFRCADSFFFFFLFLAALLLIEKRTSCFFFGQQTGALF